jgi:hypothetical protein
MLFFAFSFGGRKYGGRVPYMAMASKQKKVRMATALCFTSIFMDGRVQRGDGRDEDGFGN